MAGVKLVVLYPRPTDRAAFDQLYEAEHIPMVREHFPKLTAFTTTQVLGSPQGDAPIHWIAELHFATIEDLQASLATEGAQQTVAHALGISTGGPMTVLVCEAAREVAL